MLTHLGLTHNALLQCEIFRECYAKGAPLDDYLKIAYRSSQLVSYIYLFFFFSQFVQV
jgi:anaphase-promoting complex subunit 5